MADAQVNATVNVTNATGRDAATAEGIFLTYTSLFLMALGPIVLGSVRSVNHQRQLLVSAPFPPSPRVCFPRTTTAIITHVARLAPRSVLEKRRRGERPHQHEGRSCISSLRQRRAVRPVPVFQGSVSVGPLPRTVWSASLTAFLPQYIPKEYVNLILSVLFIGLGISALARAVWYVVCVRLCSICHTHTHTHTHAHTHTQHTHTHTHTHTQPSFLPCSVLIDPLLPDVVTSWMTKYHIKLTVTPPKKKAGKELSQGIVWRWEWLMFGEMVMYFSTFDISVSLSRGVRNDI